MLTLTNHNPGRTLHTLARQYNNINPLDQYFGRSFSAGAIRPKFHEHLLVVSV